MYQKLSELLLAKPKQAASIVFLLSVIVLSLVVFDILLRQKHANELIATSLAQSHAALLQTALDKSLSANFSMASMVLEKEGQTDWFSKVAKGLSKDYPDVSRFALSPNAVVTNVFPIPGNEVLLGFDQFLESQEASSMQKVKETGKMTLLGPLKLVQGYFGVIGLNPVYLTSGDDGERYFWGFTSVVIRLDTILDYVSFNDLKASGYDYQLLKLPQNKDTTPTVIASSVSEFKYQQTQVTLDLPGAQWQLVLSPTVSWLSFWRLSGDVFIVLLASLLLSRWVYLALKMRKSKVDLEVLVAQRTAQLSTSNLRMGAILSAIPDSFYEVNQDGVVMDYHSPRMDALYNQPGWAIGKMLTKILPPETADIFSNAMAKAKEQGYSSGFEFPFMFGDKLRWFDLSTTYSCDKAGGAGFYILLSREVTQRKIVEAELRIAATAFQTQDGILISDKDNKIIRVNSAFEKITGFNESELVGLTPNVFSSGRHSQAFYDDMFQALQRNGSWEGEIWNRRKSGEIFPEWLSISVVKDNSGQLTHYVATFKDISEKKANERRINQLNYYDSLTRLPNRRMALEEIDQMLTTIDLKHRRSAALFIDLDHFKDINDLMGHNLGDLLLQQVASRLMDSTRSGDIVSRFSGDEFVIILEDVDVSLEPDRSVYRAKHVASKIMASLKKPFELNGQVCSISASIGISVFGHESAASNDIIKQAEMAMYEAKGTGRNAICFYAPQMHKKILERVTLDNDFRRALKEHEFVLYYQPQWDGDQKMVGVEALVRWQHPENGMISPGVFIPFAEESKLILPLGCWVMYTAMEQLAQWQTRPEYQSLIMSINVSVLQFTQVDFVAKVKEALAQTGVNPASIQLELTESMLVRDQLDIIEKMQSLKQLGVLISLDDFGTGYSSLSYLQQLPIDQLKIDQTFTRAIEESDKQASLAASIIGLGQNLGMEVIAEGVETKAQFDWLKNHGCDLYQGFLLGRPQSSSDLIKSTRSSD